MYSKMQLFAVVVSLAATVAFSKPNLMDEFNKDPLLYCAAVTEPKDVTSYKADRDIPELEKPAGIEGLKLKQVQVMIRHGARTVSRQRVCWPGYDVTWNCKSGEQTSSWVHDHLPNEPHKEEELRTYNFPKHFDARPSINPMPGNCETGQLVVEGFKQHDLNGQLLANAYFNKQDPKKFGGPLFDLEKDLTDKASMDGKIYFRSSEYQRTRMSGSQLLTSMVKAVKADVDDPQIKLHVVEKKVDNIYPNEEWCYDLVDATNQAFLGEEYEKKFGDKHKEAHELSKKMLDLEADPSLPGGPWPFQPFDCIYSAVCAGPAFGLTLPDNEHWTRENVEKLLAASQEIFEWQFRANDARYSRIAFVRFFLDMKAFAISQLCTEGNKLNENCASSLFKDEEAARSHIAFLKKESQIKPNFMTLWSAHDNTLGPFIAIMGDKFWEGAGVDNYLKDFRSPFPSYASMLNIEFYDAKDGKYFRMIYNSKPVTEFIEGCPAGQQLCLVKTLFTAMDWATVDFANAPCTMQEPGCPTNGPNPTSAPGAAVSQSASVALVLAVVAAMQY